MSSLSSLSRPLSQFRNRSLICTCASFNYKKKTLHKNEILQKSKFAVRPREVSFVLEKSEEGPYWDRLLTTKLKQPWLRIDFKNWKDEDDDEAEEGQGQDLGKTKIKSLT